MDSQTRSRLRKAGNSLEPLVHVGKAGTETVLEELERHLKAKKLVKVRLNPAEESPAERAETLAKATGSFLVEVRGSTALLYRA